MIDVKYSPGIRVETDTGVMYVTRYKFKFRVSFDDYSTHTLTYSKAYSRLSEINNFANKHGVNFIF